MVKHYNNSSIKVGKTWKTVIKYILPVCIFGLWAQGVYSTMSSADSVSTIIMIILTIVLIVVPFIFAKLPAINKDYHIGQLNFLFVFLFIFFKFFFF